MGWVDDIQNSFSKDIEGIQNRTSGGGSSDGQTFSYVVPAQKFSDRKGSLERIVRPFAVVETKMPDPPPRVIEITLEGEGDEAALVWGAAADFNIAPPIEDAEADGLVPVGFSGGAPQTSKPNETKPNKPQDDRLGTIAFDMMDAQAEKGKIYNPDDKEQWVEVLRLKSIRFRGSLPMLVPQQPKGAGKGNLNTASNTSVPTKFRFEKCILKLNFKWPKWPAEPAS